MTPPAVALSARVARVRAACAALDVPALVVSHLPNVAYLSGFSGSAGVVVLTSDACAFVTDPRYRAAMDEMAAAGALPIELSVRITRGAFEPEIAEIVASQVVERVAVEAAYLPLAQWGRLGLAVRARAPSVEVVQSEGIVESCRIRKDEWEQQVLREAAARLSAVAAGVLSDLHEGVREVDVAQALEAGMRRTGFERPAFDTIVASGPTSALPHARAGERRLSPGDLVVVDFGGVFRGYSVDMTRTIAVGEPGAEARRVYEAVQKAHEAAIAAVVPGATPEAIDAAARQVLEERGLGLQFVHGTGHGLGLEVHEAPRIAAPGTARTTAAEGTFTVPPPARVEPGMVFTIEPGAYLPGFGGVRIEDDVLVTAGGCEVLTTGDRALRVSSRARTRTHAPRVTMTFDEIKQLLEVVREHELSEFELERDGFKIRVVKQGSAPVVSMAGLAPVAAPLPVAAVPAAPAVHPPTATPGATAPEEDGEVELAVVKSPIVGTFYRCPEPGAASFVDVGQPVRRNQVLCIIEAMKLMNEITSEYEGELVKCYVENGQAVQYGERLFAIKAK